MHDEGTPIRAERSVVSGCSSEARGDEPPRQAYIHLDEARHGALGVMRDMLAGSDRLERAVLIDDLYGQHATRTQLLHPISLRNALVKVSEKVSEQHVRMDAPPRPMDAPRPRTGNAPQTTGKTLETTGKTRENARAACEIAPITCAGRRNAPRRLDERRVKTA
jgi:hypothetical protein